MKTGKISKNDFYQWCYKNYEHLLLTEKAAHHDLELASAKFTLIKNVKEALFPPWEKVFRYRWDNREWKVEDIDQSELFRFLIALPCETRAIFDVLDRVFLSESCIDREYQKHRQSLKIIILGCTKPESTCFCTWVGGNPLWSHPKALFVLPYQDGFYLETGEPSQFDIMNQVHNLSDTEHTEIDTLKRDVLEKAAEEKLPAEVPQGLYALFEDEEWEKIAWKCLNCGACTYLCPTCYCFDFSTEGRLKGYQLKTWDSCMFPKFTLHASGHNPRSTFKERVRQRVLHKFSYFPIREEGRYGCVGCGKCIEICPVNWDIREAVERMVKKIGSNVG